MSIKPPLVKPMPIKPKLIKIAKLDKTHDRQAFDCGNADLNRFITQLASQFIKRQETVVYVAHALKHNTNTVAGFYTLSAMQIQQSDDPQALKKQSKHTPISCVLLGRLAVATHYQGQGLGADLLLHALTNVKQLAQTLGIAFVVVDAKDETAKSFYEAYGFVELQNKPLRLCLPTKRIP